MEGWESSGEVSIHSWSKNNTRFDALKRIRGTVSFHPHHPSPKVAQLIAKRGLLSLWLLPQGKLRASEWVPSFPSYVGHHKRDPFFLISPRILRYAARVGSVWEKISQASLKALKSHISYSPCCTLHQEACQWAIGNISPTDPPAGPQVDQVHGKLMHTPPHHPVASSLSTSPMATKMSLCRQLLSTCRKPAQLRRTS